MEGRLPGLFGIELLEIGPGHVEARLDLRPEHLAPNEFLHAGTVITLADSCAGMGCLASLPEEAVGFTTIELKTNFLGTTRHGEIVCEATALHAGRTTQVWDAVVRAGERTIAVRALTDALLLQNTRFVVGEAGTVVARAGGTWAGTGAAPGVAAEGDLDGAPSGVAG